MLIKAASPAGDIRDQQRVQQSAMSAARDFGLADVFGIHAAGPVIGRLGNANPYMARIERPHPILDGFT